MRDMFEEDDERETLHSRQQTTDTNTTTFKIDLDNTKLTPQERHKASAVLNIWQHLFSKEQQILVTQI